MNAPENVKPRRRVQSGEDLTRRTIYAGYEGADNTIHRNFYRDQSSQNLQAQKSAVALRTQARHAVRNHDIARGMLRTVVNNVVGPKGIGVEFAPKRADGSIHQEYAKALAAAWQDWIRKPEVTQRMSWAACQRAMVRARYRDGEAFAQHVVGAAPGLRHGTRVPYSLEIFEADMVPMDYHDANKRILQGIELNTWGRPTALHVIKNKPWEVYTATLRTEYKAIPWDRVIHLANIDHIGQLRGISEFASILNRLEDIKDYEESERIAAKLAARLAAFVRKGTSEDYEAPTDADGNTKTDGQRELVFDPGTIIDDLMPGEEIGIIDSKRPNPNLITFRGGQLRAAAAGFGGISYSSAAKDYNGTFSAQRQELVETYVNYAIATDDIVCDAVQPTVEHFVMTADLSGVVPIPNDVMPGTQYEAVYIGQSMPWIDPLKEAMGYAMLVQMGFASEIEVIRRRGVNPWDLLQQVKLWREKCQKEGVAFESNQVGIEQALAAIQSGE